VVNGKLAPIFALVASAGQINALVPTDADTGASIQVVVQNRNGPSRSTAVVGGAAGPGVFLVRVSQAKALACRPARVSARQPVAANPPTWATSCNCTPPGWERPRRMATRPAQCCPPVNFQIPATAAVGDNVPLQVSMPGSSTASATIAIVAQ
jgi:hypothetical protein